MDKFKIVSYFKRQAEDTIQRGNLDVKGIDDGDAYESLAGIFRELTERYCSAHGYGFLFREISDSDLEPIVRGKGKYGFLPPLDEKQEPFDDIILYKLLLVRDELLKGDSEYVVFMDADAIISNPNVTLDEFIDGQHEIWLSPGNLEFDIRQAYLRLLKVCQTLASDKAKMGMVVSPDPKRGYEQLREGSGIDLNGIFKSMSSIVGGFNEGFFIVRRTENMKNLFTIVCDHFHFSRNAHTYMNSRYGSDGYLLQHFLNTPKFYGSFAYMRPKSQGHALGMFSGKYDEGVSFIQHNYSVVKVADRLKLAQKVKANRWWRQFGKADGAMGSILIESTDVCLGDVLTTTPFFRDFSEQHPDIRLYFDFDFMLRYQNRSFADRLEAVARHCRHMRVWRGEAIDKVVSFRNAEYLQRSRTDGGEDMLACLYKEFKAQTGIEVRKTQDSVCVDLNAYEESGEVLRKFGIPDGKPICLLMFGYHPLYNSVKYPGTSKVQGIIDALGDEVTFVSLGSAKGGLQQKRFRGVIDLADRTSLDDLFALTYNARLVVSSITSLTHVASVKSKYGARDVFCFMGCRETPTWFSSYGRLSHVKYHWLGYDTGQFGKCLNGERCCVCDVTTQNESNRGQRLCKSVKVTSDNEAIAECMCRIDEKAVAEAIREALGATGQARHCGCGDSSEGGQDR